MKSILRQLLVDLICRFWLIMLIRLKSWAYFNDGD